MYLQSQTQFVFHHNVTTLMSYLSVAKLGRFNNIAPMALFQGMLPLVIQEVKELVEE